MKIIWSGLLTLGLAACVAGPPLAVNDENTVPVEMLEGHWEWRGYNRVLSVSADEFAIHSMTSMSCIPLLSGDLEMLSEFLDRFVFEGDKFFTAFDSHGISQYEFYELDGLPETCSAEMDKSPPATAEVFYRYFEENYAFFDAKDIDWSARHRPLTDAVSPTSSDDELFEALQTSLKDINDSHVGLFAGSLDQLLARDTNPRYFNAGRPAPADLVVDDMYAAYKAETDQPMPKLAYQYEVIKNLADHVKSELLQGDFQESGNGRLIWGEPEPGIGYLGIFAMAGLFDDDGELDLGQELSALEKVLDTDIIPFLKDKKSVILDVRFNPGGHDAVSLAIASRFADKRRMPFTKTARHGDTTLEPKQVWFEPQGPVQYTGPVYFLTSSMTASAAEIFSLAMWVLPHVTHMGETTNGVFSDMWVAGLPNGWTISLSNEIYRAADGNVYEGPGLPPQVGETPVFVRGAFWENVDAVYDEALAKAMSH